MQQRTTAYDVDKWSQTSLTWQPIDHANDELTARRKAVALYGKNTKEQYRVRRKTDGEIMFKIAAGKQELHPDIAPKKEKN
jgi:hypothetical protein